VKGVAMALLGSGEFDPWSVPISRWLLERSRNPGGVALVFPTAAAHEGESSFSSWGEKGLAHFGSIEVPAEVVPLRTREDAHRDDVVCRLDDASLVFFSGGNPARLAQALRSTPFWSALCEAMDAGLPYAGCSAGVACLTEMTYDSETSGFDGLWQPGIGYVRDILFGPHWDIVDTWVPGASEFIVGSVRPGQTFVGLDEDTAMIGDGTSWRVLGRRSIHVLRDDAWSEHGDGDVFSLPLAFADRS
jgi:cyanophycinase